MTETKSKRHERLATQAEIIQSLAPLLPAPEDAGESLAGELTTSIRAGRKTGTATQVVRCRGGQVLDAALSSLGTYLARFEFAGAGEPATASSPFGDTRRVGDYSASVEWTADSISMTWSTDLSAIPPDAVAFEEPTTRRALAVVVLKGASSGAISLPSKELGFDPTRVRWQISFWALEIEE